MSTLMIENEFGEALIVNVSTENVREVGCVTIDGIPYHIERIRVSKLKDEYLVDTDPDYDPQYDPDGKCVIVAPYGR